MPKQQEEPVILMAEDDLDDRLLISDAMEEAGLPGELHFAGDGIDLLDYLHHRGKYRDGARSPWPGLILLDLKMPRMNGWETLAELRSDPALRDLPVFI